MFLTELKNSFIIIVIFAIIHVCLMYLTPDKAMTHIFIFPAVFISALLGLIAGKFIQ